LHPLSSILLLLPSLPFPSPPFLPLPFLPLPSRLPAYRLHGIEPMLPLAAACRGLLRPAPARSGLLQRAVPLASLNGGGRGWGGGRGASGRREFARRAQWKGESLESARLARLARQPCSRADLRVGCRFGSTSVMPEAWVSVELALVSKGRNGRSGGECLELWKEWWWWCWWCLGGGWQLESRAQREG
jgi:hypothetical protein